MIIFSVDDVEMNVMHKKTNEANLANYLKKGILMKKSIILLALFSGVTLSACDQSPDTVLVPVPGPAGATGATGQSGDEGIQGQTGRSGDTGIQGETGETGGDTTIIIPPPVVEAPADSATPAN